MPRCRPSTKIQVGEGGPRGTNRLSTSNSPTCVALITIGHIPSEHAGMDEFARWLRTLVTEVPVTLVPATDPFWAPK